MFDKPDNTPRTKGEAIKETLNIDYNGQESTTTESTTNVGEGKPRGTELDSTGERSEEGNGTSDNGGGTGTTGEQVAETTEEEKYKKAFKTVRKVVEKAGLVIHEATPEMVAKAREKSNLEFRQKKEHLKACPLFRKNINLL